MDLNHINGYETERECLHRLITKISNFYGGDDFHWLRGYIEDVCNKYAYSRMVEALTYFKAVHKDLYGEPIWHRVV